METLETLGEGDRCATHHQLVPFGIWAVRLSQEAGCGSGRFVGGIFFLATTWQSLQAFKLWRTTGRYRNYLPYSTTVYNTKTLLSIEVGCGVPGRWLNWPLEGGGGAPVSGECIRRLPWRSHGRELRRCDAPSEASEGGGRVLVGLGLSSARWCEWTRFLSTQQAAAYTASMACVVGLSPIRPWPCRPAAHEAVRPRLALSLSPLRAKV